MAFFVVEGGAITHERLMFELKKAQEKSIKRAVLGASGGRAKSLKTKGVAVAIANDLLDTRARLQPQPQLDKREDTVVSSPRARAKKSSRMPVDWLPGEGDLAVAYELGFQGQQIDRELSMMRDFEFTRPRSDWGATYRNWFRKAKPDGQSTGQDARQLARHENYRNALAGFEDAVAARRE